MGSEMCIRDRDKALRSAATLSDRLERHWESLRLELFHSRELGLSLINHAQVEQVDASVSLDDALETYLRLITICTVFYLTKKR